MSERLTQAGLEAIKARAENGYPTSTDALALIDELAALTTERDAALNRAERTQDAYIECQRRVQDAWDQARWAKATAAALRQAVIDAQTILDEEGVHSDHIDELLAEHTQGADLLAELARLRKLEADAKAFCADYPTPPDDAMRVNDPEGYGYAVVAQALRTHLAESEVSE